MGSNVGARILLVLAFLAAWVGYDAWIVSHVVLDPGTTRAAAHALLETPAVRRGLTDELTKVLDQRLPAAAHDRHADAAVATAVRDPRVTAAFADTIARIHEAVVSNRNPGDAAEFTVDGHAFTDSLHDALAPNDPQLAAQVEQIPPLTVHIKSKDLPSLHDPRTTADMVSALGIVAALALVAASLLLRHDRRSISRAGRRTAFLAITPLVAFVALPLALTQVSGDAPQIASTLLRVYGDRVLPSAIALAATGLAIAVGAFVWPRLRIARPAPVRSTVPPYTGPAASSPPSPVVPDRPTITEKMYL